MFNDDFYEHTSKDEEEIYYNLEEENNGVENFDNSNMNFNKMRICIKLSEKSNQILFNRKNFLKKYPKLKDIETDNIMEYIIKMVFPEGFQKKIYITNLTFANNKGYDIRRLGIRPERNQGDFINEYFSEKVSLLFRGIISGKEFLVESITEIPDTDKLDFEIEIKAIPYMSPEKILGANFLYDISETDSITKYTEKKLEEWEEYLKWKKEIAKRQIYGCKYYKIIFDEQKKRINFFLVFENDEEFKKMRKYLGRDIQVFDNNYSTDKYRFKFIGEESKKNKIKFNSIEIGRYKGIISEGYLKNDSEDILFKNSEEEYDEEEYDEEEYDEDEEVISSEKILKKFKTPYIVEVAYDLNRKDLDEINQFDLPSDEINRYIQDNIIGNYYPNGFLALSAIGEFVLINRLQQAINKLKRDECYSPNLVMWLFDVSKARTSKIEEIEIEKWLNPKIARNENQRKAVQKMVSSQDLCLIQGPPGTGKTTVIAEAIYQLAKQGNRILVASQSNDAVDNALERLANVPEIRAIRLGQKSKRNRKLTDSNTVKFSEDEVLKYYYQSISSQISKNYLDRWSELENGEYQCRKDIRDAKLYNKDIEDLKYKTLELKTQEELENENNKKLNKKLEDLFQEERNVKRQLLNYEKIEKYFNSSIESIIYLSEDMLDIFENNLNKLIEESIKFGIYIIPEILDRKNIGTKQEEKYIKLIVNNSLLLKEFFNDLKNKNVKNTSNDIINKIVECKDQYKYFKDMFIEATIANDEENKIKYEKKMKDKKLELDKLNMSNDDKFNKKIEEILSKEILSKEIIEKIKKNDTKELIIKFESIIEKWNKAIEDSLKKIYEKLSKKKLIISEGKERKKLEKDIKVSSNKLDEVKNNKREINKKILAKEQNFLNIRERYNLKETIPENIIEKLEELSESYEERIKAQEERKNSWEKTLREFKKRLDNPETFKYDTTSFYKDIYIKACNVVGISCTDNMRNLTDKGFDDFDVVIIDEVSKATPPELLIPLMKARKAILVGDHRQLPPMFKEHEGSYKELLENQEDVQEEIRDLLTEENFKKFKKMVTSSLFKEYFEKADDSIKHSLLVQYRMHSDIMSVINRFYEQRLKSGLSEAEEKIEKNHKLIIKGIDGSSFIVPDKHAYWIDSSVTPSNIPIYETRFNNSTSNYNILEKYIIIELLKKIAIAYKEMGHSKENQKTVGVISFYQMQVNEIRDAFKEAKRTFDFSAINVDINTVDRFQGKEKNIIITSLVRHNKKKKVSKHVVTFERINVAFSRAQELLFIVGAKEMYENQKVELPNMDSEGTKTVLVYHNIIEILHTKGCYKTCNKIITKEVEEKIIKEYKEIGG